MEIFIGILSAGITELIKMLAKKLGKEQSKKVVLATLFLIVLLFTYLTNSNLISKETIESMIHILGSAIATYKLIMKPILSMLE